MKNLLTLFAVVVYLPLQSQISAKLMRYMDVSETQIAFVYGGDIWLVAKEGGTALQLTHSPGEESWPRFSPDGRSLAYTARYQGNMDVYTLSTGGGVPVRITHQSFPDRLVDWHPDGNRLLFASRMGMGQRRSQQFYLVDKAGGMAEKLPIPYGELATFSPDGNQLAYITKITENYPFKRYRGGLSSDIILYDFSTGVAQNITNTHAVEGKPAWAGKTIYYLSDQDVNMRMNVWAYHTEDQSVRQVTEFKDFDVSFLSAGPDDLVYEAGGELYLMDLETETHNQIEVSVISDLSTEMVRRVEVNSRIANMTASPEGKRIVFEARGELFNVPVKEGYTLNLTRSSGAFDRNPAWSPDGKHLAFWSDQSGEYEVYLQAADAGSAARKLTSRGKGFGYSLFWSPDSKKLAFIDETNTISFIDVESGVVKAVGNTNWNVGHGGRFGYAIAWSPDSRWMAFEEGLDNSNFTIVLYDTEEDRSSHLTSGFYSDTDPVFSQDGNHIFFLTNRSLSPHYSDFDNTWVYPNATQIAAIGLTKKSPSLLSPKSDEYSTQAESKKDKDTTEMVVEIDFDGLESRLEILPPEAGNIGGLASFEGKIIYYRFPNTGAGGRGGTIELYDLKEREEKTVMANVSSAVLTADGKMILVQSQGKYGIIQPAPDQKIKDPIPTDGLVMDLVPKEEWNQIFDDTWRRHRDFFYDPEMHGVDWDALRVQYGELIKDARTRWDVSNIQSNLAAELSAGHTYTFGGDNERVPSRGTGYLGIDWEKDAGGYKIGRVVRPAEWDIEVRSPFDRPGMDVAVGDYIVSVNGVELDPAKDPYAAFDGLDGATVVLEIKRDSAQKIVIECLSQQEESNLRYLEWMENNRKMVDELSDGQLGYVYMSNTSGQGQRELVRMYYGQLEKKGFIIDERFNGGGQLADRFLELLQRPVVYHLHWRHGKDHQWPIQANTGPVGMLINGWAGSGGDGLPWAFQELKAGPIVGERTLGILVGPATGHQLIDGGGITVPGARLYDNDGHWFWEGEGVAPDIEVWDDPNMLMKGRDPQMERVVTEVLKLLETQPPMSVPAPKREDRTADAINGKG